jgi:ribosomal protein L11 methyltransferase
MVSEGLDESELNRKWPVIVSNIISATLIRLAPQVTLRVESGGLWIVSGIIESNWPDVLSAAQSSGFELVEMAVEGDWVAGVLRRT